MTARALVYEALDRVADPEIPAVSVLDMGMVDGVEIDGARVTVRLLPTFTGCPAVDVIERDVSAAVGAIPGVAGVDVVRTYDPPWTSARITDRGRDRLRSYGIAPPEPGGPVLVSEIRLPAAVHCPLCGAPGARPDGAFGATPCRAPYYCSECRNPFEVFKPV